MTDDALVHPTDDPRSRYFERTAFVETMAAAMGRARGQSDSSVFGLIGAWGSGKTTVIASLEEQLSSAGWRIHNFNPWLYSDADSLRWGFLSELRDVVPPGDRWADSHANIDRLSRAIVPIAKLANVLGPDFGGAAEHLFNPERVSATKLRETVAEQLVELLEPVLIVLDDLDRLSSAELLEVFKLVRFVGRLPNIYYLLCYDEKTLIDLLENTDLVGARHSRRALDYLEKIVQLRFDIPPMRTDLVMQLFEEALRGVVTKSGATLTARDESQLSELLQTGFIERLTTPRAIKHFFAQLEAFLPSVANEVNTFDFVLLSWVRTFEPRLYGIIQSERKFFSSGDIGYEADENLRADKRRQKLEDLFSTAEIDDAHQETVLTVVRALFPAVGAIWARASIGDYGPRGARKVADEFYFDRYFNFGVHHDDLHDATVRLVLENLDSPDQVRLQIEDVERHVVTEPRRTIQKLNAERETTSERSVSLARWVLKLYPNLPLGHGWASARDQISHFIAEVLVDVTNEQLPLLVDEAFSCGAETVYLMFDATRILTGRSIGGMDEVRDWNEKGQTLELDFLERLNAFVALHTERPFDELEPNVWELIKLWGAVERNGPKPHVQKHIENKTWSALDVLSALVSTSPSEAEELGKLERLDLQWASSYLDVGQAIEAHAGEITESRSVRELQGQPATSANKRSFVLAHLSQVQHQAILTAALQMAAGRNG
ncbi:hypothetical protein AWU67_14030 [Microterricola viridarii]|uniref:KAP NTPase domain-containing protein n=2 Tax=Microterricola viridarii TaxID=412690 RepID=A0A0Y0NEY4_9MICO|nr:hypothetical protein AWU67_14030 [Microterricola viridarii]